MAKRRFCIFCGQSPLTAEDAWPLWLVLKYFATGPVTHHRGAAGSYESFPSPDSSVRVKCVCRACNNNWMSQLEDRAAPLLAPLIEGKLPPMGREDQETIAFWAVKTAMTLAQTQPVKPIPPAHMQELYLRQSVPDHVGVWVAFEDEYVPFGQYGIKPLVIVHPKASRVDPRPQGTPAYQATILIGHLALTVGGHSGPGALDRHMDVRPHATRIWPVTQSRGIFLG